MPDNAHFTYLDNRALLHVASLVTDLNKFSQDRKWEDISVPFVPVCNAEAEEIGLIYWHYGIEEYVFMPDLTGEGIDRETLDHT